MHDLPEIIHACRKGDSHAQRYLYEHMKRKWMGVCIRYVKDADDAKDVFQEASLKIFTDIATLKDPAAFDGWARRIVVNTSLNYLKSRRSYLLALRESSASDDSALDRSDEDVLARMDAIQLLTLINTMPEGYRIVFNMYMIDGYKHNEIAEILSIEESTSRSQLNKAKKFLKKILENQRTPSNEKVVGF